MLQVINRRFFDNQNRELSFPFFSGYDKVKVIYTVQVEFAVNLSFSTSVVKDGNSLQLTSGSWEDFGFIVGADISGTYGSETIPVGTTITYIDGALMMTDTALTGTDGDAFTSGSIVCDASVDAFDCYFNLIPNTLSGGDNSLIDNEVNRFQVFLDGLTIGSTTAMTQLGNQSGGANMSGTCKRTATNEYELTVNFNSWGIILESEFTTSKCLKPYLRCIAYPQFNNPTTFIQTVNTPSDANTGWYNEVGNGGTPAFEVDYFAWTDGAFNYNQPSEFTAVLNGNFDATSLFNICFFFDSDIESQYKNLPLSLHRNLMFLTNSSAIGIGTSSGIVSGVRSDGSQMSLDLDIDTTSTTATIIGTFTPNSQFIDFIESLDESDRKFKVLVRCEDYTLSDNLINPVWLPISIGTFEKYVTPLGELPDVTSHIYDHKDTQVTDAKQLVIEDDLTIKSVIPLPRFNDFQSISTEIVVRNGSTLSEFSLEKFTFNLLSFPLLTDGSRPIAQTINRAFNLSPTNQNHFVSIERRTDLDTSTHYFVELRHSYLNDWKTWQPQTNADIYFYPNQNKDWFGYIDSPWGVNYKLTFETTIGNYENYDSLLIHDYDSIDAVFEFYDLDGNLLTKPLQNEICRVKCIHDTIDPVIAILWGQITVEPFQGSPRFDISSYYAQGGIASNPLIPLDGETTCVLTYSTHYIVTECLFDPSKMADPSNVSFTSRVSGRIEKEKIENRHKESFETAKIPKNPTIEDRGGDECCCSRDVIASASSNDSYKNDITSNWQIGETVTFELKTCAGVLTAFQPTAQSFPNDVNAKYCTINWKDVLLADGCGRFKLYANYSVAGISGTVLLETFTLNEWVDGVESWDKLVNGTVRVMSVFNDANEHEGINFTNANVVDSLRFNGDFNDFQPNMAIRNLQHRDNSLNKVKRENLTRWTLKADASTICTIDKLVNLHLLAENTIYISDYNQYCYDKTILDKAFIVSEQGGGTKIENYGGSNKKGLTCELELKVQKSKTHFGSIGSSANPNPSIPPIPNTVSGECASASYSVVNSALTVLASGTIASGGSADIPIADISFTDSNGTISSVPAGVDIVASACVAPTYKGTALPMKTGQEAVFITGDDGATQYGRQVSWVQLSQNNFFGHNRRFTGITGGYHNGTAYVNVSGGASTYSAQFPNNIIIDWDTYDEATGSFVMYYNVIAGNQTWNNARLSAIALSIGTFTSGWHMANWNEFFNVRKMGEANGNNMFNYPPFSGNSSTGIGTGTHSIWLANTSSAITAIRVYNYLYNAGELDPTAVGAKYFACRIGNISEL